jgi:sulfide:quinone oxidoreductase
MDRVHLHLFTPELKPLGLFGDAASDAVAALLDAAQITVHTGVSADIKDPGHVETGFGDPVEVDRVIALPALDGPAITGVRSDARGFISVDDFGRVVGLADVYAAGDATDQPIKQGGLACQQADIVAGDIAARAGARVDVEPLRPVLRGRLLTGHLDRFLRKDVKRRSDVRDEPLWWPPAKVSSRYLAPYLEMEHLISLPVREGFSDHGIDVEIPLWWEKRDRRGVMELNRIER